MSDGRVIGLDGHDGAGKTTLAQGLAERLGGQTIRPFGGQAGVALLAAYHQQDYALTMQVGDAAIREALARADPATPLILDRCWMTVASLVPAELFTQHWNNWIPTILCWCDLPTTLQRLDLRPDESRESIASHAHFLSTYLACADRRPSPVFRTDGKSFDSNLAALEPIARALMGE